MNRVVRALKVLFGIRRKYQKRTEAKEERCKPRLTYYQRRKASERMSESNKKRWELMKKLGVGNGKLMSDSDLLKIELQRSFGDNATNQNGN